MPHDMAKRCEVCTRLIPEGQEGRASGEVSPLLVVTADAACRTTLAEHLSTLGHHVLTAQSSSDALAILAHQCVGLTFVDLASHGLDGIALLSHIAGASPHALCVALHDPGMPQRLAPALDAGAWHYLVKPVTPRLLEHTVARALAFVHLQRKDRGCLRLMPDDGCRRAGELRRAVEQAQAAQELKAHILANMSHELRTPLNGIMGMAQMLIHSNPSEDHRRYLEMVLQSSRTLLDVINNVLTLSSIESGAISFLAKPFSLHAMLYSLGSMFASSASDKGLHFSLHIADSLPDLVQGDKAKLAQCIVNVVDNAITYTDNGSVSVQVDTMPDARPNHAHLCVAVTDTGIGIAPEKMATIFDSFTLGEDVLTKKYSGPGLGLAITRQLLGKMGGEITVTSTRHKGSVFRITIELELTQPEHADAALRADWSCPRPSRSLRILLAEDEEVNQTFVSHLLARVGHSVTVADNGEAALRALARQDFDLVLMDIQMPRMNGLAATRAIREGTVPGLRTNIPIIALTAYTMAQDQQTALDAGMDDFLTKPVDVAALMETLERAMRHERPAS
ncbi:MAG: response regulator [Desulfovibrionaceae bacterium]